MAITWQTAGAIAYSAASGASVSPAYPTGSVQNDKLILVVGQKPTTANGGGVTTPSGWSLVTSLTGAGGYGTTLGADTGNTNLYVYERTVPTGGLSGTLAVTLTNNNVSWAGMLRLTSDTGAWGTVAGTTGSDTAAGNVGVTFVANPGVIAGDAVLAALCIPTDVTTPTQFSAEALTQAGVTFGVITESDEPDSTAGNDIGGLICYASVASGTATGVPTLTATAGGTTTNVRGPAVFVRLREGAAGPRTGSIAATEAYDSAAFSGTSPAADSLLNYSPLVIPFDGANNGTAFTDGKGHTLTAVGTAITSTAQSKWGGASGYFDGGGSITSPNSASLDVNNVDFCIEFWIRLPAASVGGQVIQYGKFSGFNSTNYAVKITPTGVVNVAYGNAATTQSSDLSNPAGLPRDQWVFIKVSRTVTAVQCWVNGVNYYSPLTATVNTAIIPAATLFIGVAANGGLPLNAYIDDLRVTIGNSRVATNTTIPTSAFQLMPFMFYCSLAATESGVDIADINGRGVGNVIAAFESGLDICNLSGYSVIYPSDLICCIDFLDEIGSNIVVDRITTTLLSGTGSIIADPLFIRAYTGGFTFPNLPDLDAFTISFWFNTDGYSYNIPSILGKIYIGNTYSDSFFALRAPFNSTNAFVFELRNELTASVQDGVTPYDQKVSLTSGWHHCLITRNSSLDGTFLYIDDIQLQFVNIADPLIPAYFDLLNFSQAILGSGFGGKLADVKVYSSGSFPYANTRIGVVNATETTAQTSITYYLRGWDSAANNFVYWSSLSSPDFNPVSTLPALVGGLVGSAVVGQMT